MFSAFFLNSETMYDRLTGRAQVFHMPNQWSNGNLNFSPFHYGNLNIFHDLDAYLHSECTSLIATLLNSSTCLTSQVLLFSKYKIFLYKDCSYSFVVIHSIGAPRKKNPFNIIFIHKHWESFEVHIGIALYIGISVPIWLLCQHFHATWLLELQSYI